MRLEKFIEAIVVHQVYVDELKKRVKFYDWVKEHYPEIIRLFEIKFVKKEE